MPSEIYRLHLPIHVVLTISPYNIQNGRVVVKALRSTALSILKYSMFVHVLFACGPAADHDQTNKIEQEEPGTLVQEGDTVSGFGLTNISSFLPEPGTCDAYHSRNYYCDGYTQRNLPLTANDGNPTAETDSTTAPAPGYVGLQVLGNFDSTKPSVIYIHGWQVINANNVFGFPDQWAQQARFAGYNVLQFHWSKIAYDSGSGCPGLGWFGSGNIPCNAAHALYKSGGAADVFLAEYAARFSGYNQNVRLVAQSLGAPLAIYAAYRMYKDSAYTARKPNRIDLIDPFIMPGMGGDRSKPYDGQIPPDASLPSVYKNNIVTSFVSGSACHSNWNPLPPNHLSQYCQSEGMAWHLVKTHNVGMIDFSSAVGGAAAQDFAKVMLFQAFSGSAFKGDLTARHTAPNASYFYSFKSGTPSGGYDASTADSTILTNSRKQAVDRINMSVKQTAGFDTITFGDDAFVPR